LSDTALVTARPILSAGMRARRNGTCPCGSRAKFKACCHPRQFQADAELLDRLVVGLVRDRFPGWTFVTGVSSAERKLGYYFYRPPERPGIAVIVGFPPGPLAGPHEVAGDVVAAAMEQMREQTECQSPSI
jgi:hypothetical protein